MYRNYLIPVLLFMFIGCKTQSLPEINTEFSASPLLFLKSEQSVVKNYDAKLQINSSEYATYHIRKVVTILNPEARDSGKLILPYGGFQNINNVEGALYSENGKLIRRLHEDDGMDLSLSEGYTLYQDTRLKIFELYHDDYPYTVVYDYEIALKGLLSLPTFYPQSRNQYVEKARLEVRIPRDLNLNFHSSNVAETVLKSSSEQDSVFVWQLKDLEPLKQEPYGRSFVEATPSILLAIETFKMADSEGKMDSWNSFGQWYYSLAKNRNELPIPVQREVETIFENAGDRRQGIKELYEYMQNKTRYVSIQLGLGGWQPYEATFVEEKGYGDCKALTNYMQAILHHVGVEAYPVLIKNSTENTDIVTEFPSNQFNHVILWVPEADTIWLESTSQTIPFNYIGLGNSDRHGLAVTPDSSFLIKTPLYDHRSNRTNEVTSLQLDREGKAVMNIRRSYSGYYIDQLFGNLAGKSKSGRIKWVYENLPFDTFDIDEINFSDLDNKESEPVLSFDISNVRIASKTGSRLFVPVNKLNKWQDEFPAMTDARDEEVYLDFSFREVNSTTLKLPEGYVVEAMPKSIELETDFSTYHLKLDRNKNNEIEITRVLEITEKLLPAEKYDELRDFFLSVDEYDSKNIVLNKSG